MEEKVVKAEQERGMVADVADTATNEVLSQLLGELLGGLFNV